MLDESYNLLNFKDLNFIQCAVCANDAQRFG